MKDAHLAGLTDSVVRLLHGKVHAKEFNESRDDFLPADPSLRQDLDALRDVVVDL